MFSSPHFTLHPLAEGVHAAIAVDGGYAISNSGIIDLGELCVVFDTMLTPTAALDLRRAAEDLAGRTPGIIVNSHYHNDHIWGNQVFDRQTLILASAETLRLMETEGQAELREYAEGAPTRLAAVRQQYQDAATAAQRDEIALWVAYFEGIAADLPRLALRYPNVLLDEGGALHGAKRSAQLHIFAGAHSGSDLVLHLLQDGVVFMADLLFVNCHPYLGDGDPQKLLAALEAVGRLDAAVFVPGHGPVGTRADLQALVEYIHDCLAIAGRLVEAGPGAAARASEVEIPARYRAWQQSRFFSANLRALCKKLQNGPAA